MAKLPVPQERVVFSGASFSSSAGGGGGRQLPLANAMQQWAAQRREQQDREALERVQNAATTAQQQVGTAGLAEAPEDTTGVFRQAFEQKARATFAQLSLTDAQREINRLAREHPDDPEQFSTKFNDYMVGQVMPLRETDASAAFELQTALDDLGSKVLMDVESNAAARARSDQQALALAGLDDALAEARDVVKADGTEIALADQQDLVGAEYDALRENGLITNAQWRAGKQQAQTSLTREMYFGQFEQLIESGDVRGARGLIDHANSGILFDDNDQGRRLASELATDLKARLSVGEERRKGEMAAYRSVAQDGLRLLSKSGQAPQSEAFDQALMGLASSDSVNDRLLAQQIQAALKMGGTIPQLNRMTPEELAANEQALPQMVGALPGENITALSDLIRNRREEIAAAKQSGDLMSLAGVPVDAPIEEREVARREVARVTRRPLAQVDHYSREQAELVRDQVVQALDSEEIGEATERVTSFLNAGNPATAIKIAQEHGFPELGALGAMTVVGGPELTSSLLAFSNRGPGVDQTQRSDLLNNSSRERIREIAAGLSFGSPRTADAVESRLQNALAGVWDQLQQQSDSGASAGDAREEFNRLTAPLRNFDELANGRRIPGGVFSPQAVEVVNNALGDGATELFGDATLDPRFVGSLTPVPGGNDAVFLVSDLEPNRLLTDANGEPIVLNVPEPTAEEQVDAGVNLEGEALVSRGTGNARMSMLQIEVPTAARAVDSDPEVMSSIFMANQQTPQRQTIGRQFNMGFAEDNLALLDPAEYDRVWSQLQATGDPTLNVGQFDVPDPWDSVDGAVLAAPLILRELEKKFDDPDQILAAYWIGADVIEAAGDRWREEALTADAAAFIARVKGAMQ